jgi:hypothetical protein
MICLILLQMIAVLISEINLNCPIMIRGSYLGAAVIAFRWHAALCVLQFLVMVGQCSMKSFQGSALKDASTCLS